MFVWNPGDLNPEQEAAIAEERSVFLVACPGSGKTRTLTYKIARELSKLQPDDNKWVIAITYTHRAADEIHERIENLGVDTSKLWIGTIHSFCLEWIIKPYAIYHDALKNGFRVINSHDTERLITEICKAYRNPIIEYWDCGHYYTSTGLVLACAAHNRPSVQSVLDEYHANLLEKRQIDFELILSYAYALIAQQPSISKLLGCLFSCVLADELSAMAGIDFEKMELSQNYRSSDRIVEYFGNYNVYATKIESAAKHKDYPSLISYDSTTSRENLEEQLTRLIRYNIETVGISPNEVCVLAPWWMHLASMTRKLVAAMPEYSFDGPGMVPFSRDIDNFWYKLSKIVLTEASPRMYVRRSRWAGEVLSALSDSGADISKVSRKSLLRECNSITIAEQDGLTYLAQFFDALFARIGVDFISVATLIEHYDAFFESSKARILRLQREGAEFIGDISTFRKVFESRIGITVSTIHGVKGAEYDAVIAY